MDIKAAKRMAPVYAQKAPAPQGDLVSYSEQPLHLGGHHIAFAHEDLGYRRRKGGPVLVKVQEEKEPCFLLREASHYPPKLHEMF